MDENSNNLTKKKKRLSYTGNLIRKFIWRSTMLWKKCRSTLFV